MRIAHDAVRVRVPATSANLGPGFDVLGMAVTLYDDVVVRAVAGPTRTVVTGEGEGTVADGEDHLLVRAVRAGLEELGAPQVGLEVTAHNAIPHGRGLGSSAGAVVAGLAAARALVNEPEAMPEESLLALATEFEGHPDNAAPAVYGGARIAWTGPEGAVRSEPVRVAPGLRVSALVPQTVLPTSVARSVLPPRVDRADAVFNAARVGLLVLALQGRTDLLLEATDDRLHQDYRREVLRESHALMARLREVGLPAVISGAGPTVLVLAELAAPLREALRQDGWRCHVLAVDPEGVRAEPL